MSPNLYALLFYTWTLSEILIGVVTRTRRDSGNVQDRGSLRILWITIFSSIFASQWIAATQPQNMFTSFSGLKQLAVLTLILGLAIRWTAVFSLGKAFSSNVAIRASQTLNTSGFYRWVRHPSYLGLLIIFFAIGLHTSHCLAFACATLPTTAALLYRIHVEEIALNSAFGSDYAAYSRRAKRLIPGLY
jgi:protein-S-isoprenylcysteine O-methyltransferase Ste14